MKTRIYLQMLSTVFVVFLVSNQIVAQNSPCTPGVYQTFTNNTPVAIPFGPSVVTSTIAVSGASSYLYDVNVLTHITHNWCMDLDITVTSPAGTVVTLTSDNGGLIPDDANKNVFNGTIWDDGADPAGQVPYTTNSGLVTDHSYTDNVLASPLTPEEALGAFIGENPNGVWTITISDDDGDHGEGELVDWSLSISTLSAPPVTAVTSFTNNSPVAISDIDPSVVTSTILVADAGAQLLDVNLSTFIIHTWCSDLDITIQSPQGTIVTLTSANGDGYDNVFNGTFWDDNANPAGQVPYDFNNGLVTDHAYTDLTLASPLAPEEALAAFIGEDPNGVWTLTISDNAFQDGGLLNSWTLDITTSLCNTITLPITLLNFEGQKNGNAVDLSWITSSEHNNSHFEIETSKDGNHFYRIGRVNSTGNSNINQAYSFIDNSPARGTNFYRLKQLDLDNRSAYSPTIAIIFDNTSRVLTIYPNPAKDKLSISFAKPENNVTIRVIASDGKVVRTEIVGSVQRNYELDISRLNPGFYILEIITNQEKDNIRFIKE